MNRINQYFIGEFLSKADDPFQQARARLLINFIWVSFVLLLIPTIVLFQYGFHFHSAVHMASLAVLLYMPFYFKRTLNLNISLQFFIIISLIVDYIMNLSFPVDATFIAVGWVVFKVVFSAILIHGTIRWVYVALSFTTLIFVLVNKEFDGILIIKSLERQVPETPILIGVVPVLLVTYIAITYSKSARKAQIQIRKQKDDIEEAHQEIKDSVNYARRIQEALLPSNALIKNSFESSFVLYKPKAVVAGDFYWMDIQDDSKLLAVADCTGHGVPGAMVSVVCHNALNRSTREFKLRGPGEIFDKTRELVVDTFAQSESDVKDGMDVTLISFKEDNVLFSGANNPLYKVSNGVLEEFKGDKQPIGRHEKTSPFQTHRVDVSKGDMIYLFTDGYADQFGGPNGKKFKYKPFKELLTKISDLPMEEQKSQLDQTIEKWKGQQSQVDDICIIGIRC